MTFIFRDPVFWMLIVFTSLLAIVWCFSRVLTPYIFGVILAYLLDPLVDKFEGLGLPRAISSISIMLIALSVLFLCVFLFVPALIGQIESLLVSLPDIYIRSSDFVESILPDFVQRDPGLTDGFLDLKSALAANGINIASKFASYALATFDFLVLFLIVPVITFYLLMDWDKILHKFSNYLPRRAFKEVYEALLKIDNVLSGFVRGQLLICLALSVLYSVSLLALGLNYSLLIGLFAGLISFIPFLGASVGAIIALSVAALQFWSSPVMIAYVGIVFIVGQLIESNVLTPKLVGNSVRLHPVMIMLSVSIGAAISGLTGVLLAVPVAAIGAVLFRELLSKYLNSSFFLGTK